MKLTKTTLKELTKKYRAVLIKCAMLNAIACGVLYSGSAMADGLKKIADISGGNGGNSLGNSASIYFGNYWQNGSGSNISDYTKSGIKWRVLSNEDSKVLLLSDQALYADAFKEYTGEEKIEYTQWNASDVRATLNNTTAGSGFAGDAFSSKELDAIADTSIDDSLDKLFLLSKGEAENSDYGFTKDADRTALATKFAKNVKIYGQGRELEGGSGTWWLRSPGYTDGGYPNMYVVYSAGGLANDQGVTWSYGVRPAFNLDASKVLFATAAVGGKSAVTVGSGFSLDNTYDGSNGWKLTLKDTSIAAPTDVSLVQQTIGSVDELAEGVEEGGTIDLTNGVSGLGNPIIKYTAAAITGGAANYVSAIAVDASGNYVNYAKISGEADGNAGVSVDITNLADGNYKMYVFAEQANGDYQTDYASAFSNTDGYGFMKGTVTNYEGVLTTGQKDKNLTAKLGSDFNLVFESGSYNTSITLDENKTGKITADSTNGTTLTGKISVGSGAVLDIVNKFTLSGVVDGTGTINIKGDVTANANITQNTVDLKSGSLHVKGSLTATNTNANGGSLNLVNNSVNETSLGNLTLNSSLNISVDVDLATPSMDTISVSSVSGSAKLHIAELNLIGSVVEEETTVAFAGDNLKNFITINDSYTLGGINYNVTYDKSTGKLTFIKTATPPPGPDPVPPQGDVIGDVVKGVFSGVKNTVQSTNEAVKASVRVRLAQLTNGSTPTSSTSSKKGQSGGDEDETYGLWAQAIYSHVNRDKTGSSAGFKGHSEGVVLGADAEVAENVIAGFAYAYTNSNMKSNGAKSDIDTHGFYAYGQYKPSDWFINGSIGFGLSKADPKGSDKDIKSKFYSIDALAGYEMNYDFGNLTPAGGLRYVRIEQDSYRENGSKIEAKDADTLTAVVQLGWNNVYQVAGKEITPKASVGFIYDVKSENNKVTVSSAGAKFLTEDGRLKRFGTEVSVGADAKLTNNWNVSLDYTGEFRQHYENHTGTVSVRYDF